MGHVTSLRSVTNRTTVNLSIIKLESPSVKMFIAAGGRNNFTGEAVPWSEKSSEVLSKAFLIRRNATSADDGIGSFYLFQDHNGNVCWSTYNSGNPSYERRNIGPYIDEPFGNPAHLEVFDQSISITGPRYA